MDFGNSRSHIWNKSLEFHRKSKLLDFSQTNDNLQHSVLLNKLLSYDFLDQVSSFVLCGCGVTLWLSMYKPAWSKLTPGIGYNQVLFFSCQNSISLSPHPLRFPTSKSLTISHLSIKVTYYNCDFLFVDNFQSLAYVSVKIDNFFSCFITCRGIYLIKFIFRNWPEILMATTLTIDKNVVTDCLMFIVMLAFNARREILLP